MLCSILQQMKQGKHFPLLCTLLCCFMSRSSTSCLWSLSSLCTLHLIVQLKPAGISGWAPAPWISVRATLISSSSKTAGVFCLTVIFFGHYIPSVSFLLRLCEYVCSCLGPSWFWVWFGPPNWWDHCWHLGDKILQCVAFNESNRLPFDLVCCSSFSLKWF